MAATTLTANGQISLPDEIRKRLGLHPGDRIDLSVRPDGIVELKPAEDKLMSLCGSIRPERRGVSIEEMNEAIRSIPDKT